MKKLFTVCLVSLLCLSLVACQKDEKGSNNTNIKDTTEILSKTWDNYPKDDQFPVTGGGYTNSVDGKPGKMDIKDQQTLTSLLVVPKEATDKIEEASSLMNAMNANLFTAGAYRLKDAKDMDDFTTTLKDAILKNQWLCGFPEVLVMVQVNDQYVVSLFGNRDLIKTFKKDLMKQYSSAKVVVEEDLA